MRLSGIHDLTGLGIEVYSQGNFGILLQLICIPVKLSYNDSKLISPGKQAQLAVISGNIRGLGIGMPIAWIGGVGELKSFSELAGSRYEYEEFHEIKESHAFAVYHSYLLLPAEWYGIWGTPATARPGDEPGLRHDRRYCPRGCTSASGPLCYKHSCCDPAGQGPVLGHAGGE